LRNLVTVRVSVWQPAIPAARYLAVQVVEEIRQIVTPYYRSDATPTEPPHLALVAREEPQESQPEPTSSPLILAARERRAIQAIHELIEACSVSSEAVAACWPGSGLRNRCLIKSVWQHVGSSRSLMR
jgi:hypothetical protein